MGAFQIVAREQARQGQECSLAVSQPAVSATASRGASLVTLGHAATSSPGVSPSGQMLEVRDARGGAPRPDASVRLQAAIDQMLPPPGRYRAVWTLHGASPLTVWMPVPPTGDFVALGMVVTATSSAQQPPQDSMRCVPKGWVRRVAVRDAVWQGTDGCVWRTAHGLLAAAKGRQPPQVFELVSDSFPLHGYRG